MFERFTEKARTVVVLAQQDARERGDSAIDTGHVLRALLAVPDNLALMVLEGFSVRRADLEADLAGRAPTPSSAGSAEDADALAALGIDLDEVRRRIEEALCATRRSTVFPVQPGGTWREVSGSNGLPGAERLRGQEHARKPAAGPRRPGRCVGRPA